MEEGWDGVTICWIPLKLATGSVGGNKTRADRTPMTEGHRSTHKTHPVCVPVQNRLWAADVRFRKVAEKTANSMLKWKANNWHSGHLWEYSWGTGGVEVDIKALNLRKNAAMWMKQALATYEWNSKGGSVSFIHSPKAGQESPFSGSSSITTTTFPGSIFPTLLLISSEQSGQKKWQ